MKAGSAIDAMAQVHRLFHAVQLDAAAADRLHVTLHWLQDPAGAVPEALMSAAPCAGGIERFVRQLGFADW